VERQDSVRAEALLLRESRDPYWIRLRDLLRDKGLDPKELLIGSWPEDANLDEGWIVTTDARVYLFQLRHGARGDINRQLREATLERWEEITSQPDRWYPREEVEAALRTIEPASDPT
jgi:hypothetical protein